MELKRRTVQGRTFLPSWRGTKLVLSTIFQMSLVEKTQILTAFLASYGGCQRHFCKFLRRNGLAYCRRSSVQCGTCHGGPHAGDRDSKSFDLDSGHLLPGKCGKV